MSDHHYQVIIFSLECNIKKHRCNRRESKKVSMTQSVCITSPGTLLHPDGSPDRAAYSARAEAERRKALSQIWQRLGQLLRRQSAPHPAHCPVGR